MIRLATLRELRERGDTIVEVLIAITILSVILTGAYVTSNKSLQEVRDSQEHGEALTIAQSQVEDIRTLGTPTVVDNCFAVQTSGTPIIMQPSTSCYVPSNNTALQPETNAAANCGNGNTPYCYKVDVRPGYSYLKTLTLPGGSIYTFPQVSYQIEVTWTALGGGTDSSTLYYRSN